VPYNTSKIGGAAALAEWFPRNRFQGSSIPSPTPLTSTDQAGMAPFFQEHVSQFIVEFAGDFLSQNANGDVTDTVPDGQIDWVYATRGDWVPTNNYAIGDYVIYSGNYFQAIQNIPGAATNVAPTNASPWQTAIPPKQIRWYGMPRDSAGSGQVISSYHSGLMTANELNDVVPLADLWNLSAANKTRPLPYETETIPSLIAPSIATSATLLGTFNTSYNGDYNQAMTTPAQARYTAVWRNDVPAMVRILMKVDDPTNAVQDGPWFEYIFKLK
jgi:hypothetical protein